LIGRVPNFVIDNVEVEIHFAGIFGFELSGLKFDHDKAAERQMVKQQIDVEIIFADRDMKLPSDEGESLAQFDEELF
jgi:hypothetical protein